MTDWYVIDLGTISYKKGLELQQEYWQKAVDGDDHYILLLEHTPVITLGRRTEPEHLLLNEEELKVQGIDLYKVNRGGSATYHAPGQLVGYIICKSSRFGGIHELVTRVLNSIQQVISDFEINCVIDPENPGIWTNSDTPRKLAAVGMQNKHGYTLHGFAINVHLPLTGFSAIVPCGLTLPVSTMSIELGKIIRIEDVKTKTRKILLQELTKKVKKNI